MNSNWGKRGPDKGPRRARKLLEKGECLSLDLKPVAGQFVQEVVYGPSTEVACFGARGDGKTWSALIGMILHAQEHAKRGFVLPVPWMGIADTFQSHRLKTIRTLRHPLWRGSWVLKNDDHLALFIVNEQPLVALDLFGIEDKGAIDRVRMETCGVWFEEASPSAVMVSSSGMDETSWSIALTSRRVESYKKPAVLTENYPDEDHWTWQRFVLKRHPGTAYFRIPPGERASVSDREEWAVALKDRPDLILRLLAGEPGSIAMGPQVAQGYGEDRHVLREEIKPREDVELFFGHDGGHTPATIIGQDVGGFLRIYAGLCTTGAGMKQHLQNTVIPWLGLHAPWALKAENHHLLIHRWDRSMEPGDQSNMEETAAKEVIETLGGMGKGGPIPWDGGRKEVLLASFNRSHAGQLALQISAGRWTEDLRRAFRGRWYYAQDASGALKKDLPHKPNHPWEDLGDAFCYLLSGMIPQTDHGDRLTLQRYAHVPRDPFAALRDLGAHRRPVRAAF